MTDYIIIIIMVLLFSGCSTNQGFEGYRYNPFQYPYPEYYLKAETIPISSEKMKAENNMVQLEYFGLRSYVQAESFNPKLKDVRENTIIFKDHDKILVIVNGKVKVYQFRELKSVPANRLENGISQVERVASHLLSGRDVVQRHGPAVDSYAPLC